MKLMRYQTPAISQSKNNAARQTSFDVSWITKSVSKQRGRKVDSKLGPNTYTCSQTPEQVWPCRRPAAICHLDVKAVKTSQEPPRVQLSFRPTSSRFYRYQMVRLSLCKHWKENPAETILKIGQTDFLELFRSLSWRENKTKEVFLHVLASLAGVSRNHGAF